jgi:hypothetical protein
MVLGPAITVYLFVVCALIYIFICITFVNTNSVALVSILNGKVEGSIPDRVIPKTQKMGSDAFLLGTQH